MTAPSISQTGACGARDGADEIPGQTAGLGLSAVSSLPTARAVSDGSPRLSKQEFADLAVRLLREGKGWKNVAYLAGCSEDVAKARGNKLGIYATQKAPKRWTNASITHAAKLAAKHGGDRAADMLGMDPAALRMALSRAGISICRLRRKMREAAGL